MLLADSQFVATQWLHAASAETKNDLVMIDIPDVNITVGEIAQALVLQSFDKAGIYKVKAPDTDVLRLYTAATLELELMEARPSNV